MEIVVALKRMHYAIFAINSFTVAAVTAATEYLARAKSVVQARSCDRTPIILNILITAALFHFPGE